MCKHKELDRFGSGQGLLESPCVCGIENTSSMSDIASQLLLCRKTTESNIDEIER